MSSICLLGVRQSPYVTFLYTRQIEKRPGLCQSRYQNFALRPAGSNAILVCARNSPLIRAYSLRIALSDFRLAPVGSSQPRSNMHTSIRRSSPNLRARKPSRESSLRSKRCTRQLQQASNRLLSVSRRSKQRARAWRTRKRSTASFIPPSWPERKRSWRN